MVCDLLWSGQTDELYGMIRLVEGYWPNLSNVGLSGLEVPQNMVGKVGRGLSEHPCIVENIALMT